MRKFLAYLSIFLLLSGLVLYLLDGFYTRYHTNHLNVCSKPDWIFSQKNKTFDYAFMGNSRVYNMVDVVGFEKNTGKVAINLGVTGSNYSEQYLVLDKFFKSGNKVKQFLLQVDMISLNYTKLPFKLHFPTYMHLLNDTTVMQVYRDNATDFKYYTWKYIPFVRYMEYSNHYDLYKMLKGGFECQKSYEFDNSRGTTYENKAFKSFNIYRYWNIHPTDWKYLFRIISLVKTNGGEVVFYTAPVYDKNMSFQVNNHHILKTISRVADSLDIRYFNFMSYNYKSSKDTTLFYDNFHMNEKGSIVLTRDIADSLGF